MAFVASAVRLVSLLHCISPVISACAQVENAQSSGWLDRDGITKKFSIQFAVTHWVAFTQISLTWPGEMVNVEHAYNVQSVEGHSRGETVIVALGRTASNPPQFVIMGTGTQTIRPRIECNTISQNNLPPPSPPHAIDCPLVPTYEALRTWDTGENVQITFQSWRDAGLVRLLYWGHTGLQIEAPVGATLRSTTVVGSDTLIVLQLGTSCEDRVVDDDGIVVSTPGQMTNCVPHRAETMHVTFNLAPPAVHNPRISCHVHEPPPPPPPGRVTPSGSGLVPSGGAPAAGASGGVSASGAPESALHGGYAPLVYSPPSPRPPSPPPSVRVGASVRSLPDCGLGATARVVRLQPTSRSTQSARIEIEPDHWLEGYIFLLGVSGSQLDIRDDVTNAGRLTPIIDPTGTMVLFGFSLGERTSAVQPQVVALTVTGGALNVRQLTCRPAPAPPPAAVELPTGTAGKAGESSVATLVSQLPYADKIGFIFVDATVSDIALIVIAVLLTVYMVVRQLCKACCSSGRERARVGGFELPTSDEGLSARTHHGCSSSRRERTSEGGREWRSRSREEVEDEDDDEEEDRSRGQRGARVGEMRLGAQVVD